MLSLLAPYVAAAIALLAAILSLVATGRTNRNARLQQERALAHDARQRDRERTMTLRRDVYIPIAQAISHAQSSLGQLLDPEADHKQTVVAFAADLATMGKIHAVGSEQSIAAMMRYLKVLAGTYIQLLTARIDLLTRKEAIAKETALIAQADTAMQRFKELAAQLHLAGNAEAQAERLGQLMESEQKSHKEHLERRGQLLREQVTTQLALLERLAAALDRTGEAIPDVVLAARADLDLPLDSAEYRGLFAEQQQGALQAIRDVQEQLRRTMGMGG